MRDDMRAGVQSGRIVPPFKPLPAGSSRPMAPQPERQRLVVQQNSTALRTIPAPSLAAMQEAAIRQQQQQKLALQQQRKQHEVKLRQQQRMQQEALALQVLQEQRQQQQEAMRQKMIQQHQQQNVMAQSFGLQTKRVQVKTIIQYKHVHLFP